MLISADSLCWVILLPIFLCDRTAVFWNSCRVQTLASSQYSLQPWYRVFVITCTDNWGKKRITRFSDVYGSHSISPFHNTLLLAMIHICNAEYVLLHIKFNNSSLLPVHTLCDYIADFTAVLVTGLCSQPTRTFWSKALKPSHKPAQ